jgi:hypothetical protein
LWSTQYPWWIWLRDWAWLQAVLTLIIMVILGYFEHTLIDENNDNCDKNKDGDKDRHYESHSD